MKTSGWRGIVLVETELRRCRETRTARPSAGPSSKPPAPDKCVHSSVMRSSRSQRIMNAPQRFAIDAPIDTHPNARLKLNLDQAADASRAIAPVRCCRYSRCRVWPRYRHGRFARRCNLDSRESWRRSLFSFITWAAKLSIEKLSAPGVKLPSPDLVPLDGLRYRRAGRKGFADDRQLLPNRPDAPPANASDNLNAGPATTHTTGRRTTRIALNLAVHPALRQNTQDSKITVLCARRLPDNAYSPSSARSIALPRMRRTRANSFCFSRMVWVMLSYRIPPTLYKSMRPLRPSDAMNPISMENKELIVAKVLGPRAAQWHRSVG
jgi:hypothetical protein